jgi:hypothetical protein
LNRANANTWTALQQFAAGASSTQISSFGNFYVGGTATTTIVGNLGTSTFSSFISAVRASTTATSTLAGINLPYGGCFAVNGTCITSHDAVTVTGEDYLSISGQAITANAIDPDDLDSADFGDFTCNGTTCSLDADTVAESELDLTAVTLADFTNDTNFITLSSLSATSPIIYNNGTGAFTFNSTALGLASTTAASALNSIYVGRTATTTIVGDQGTSTFSSFISASAASTTATSTLAGVNLPYGGCFAVGGTCIVNSPVTSVSASNSTLTISPTTGAVQASLNLGNANVWANLF